jgi:hypothetical protein
MMVGKRKEDENEERRNEGTYRHDLICICGTKKKKRGITSKVRKRKGRRRR